jgi:hypothetical protein
MERYNSQKYTDAPDDVIMLAETYFTAIANKQMQCHNVDKTHRHEY